jgi:hypothetical protein
MNFDKVYLVNILFHSQITLAVTLHVSGGGGGVQTLIFISNKPEAEGVTEPLYDITLIYS